MPTPMTTNGKPCIAIIGAGIGGLSLCAALGHLGKGCDLDIHVYEASSVISEIGAGISFWPRTWKIIKSIGLEEKLLELLPQPPDDSMQTVFHMRKSDQSNGFHFRDMLMKGNSKQFHRPALQKVLLDRMKGKLHLSHRFVDYEEKGNEVCLFFEDGSTATCDLLIGMDGIKSAVRKCFLGKQGLPDSPILWSGTSAYRGLIPLERLSSEFPGHHAINGPTMFTGKMKHIVSYPVIHENGDKLINVNACVTDPSKEGLYYDGPTTIPCSKEELLSTFQLWEEEVQVMLRCIMKPTKWVLRAISPLPRYASGRVVLGGDAAHAMTPHLGAGAGMAIEDAYILASLICDKVCTNEMVPRVSEIYNTIRCPLGNGVLEGSKIGGQLCELIAPGFEDVREGDAGVSQEMLNDLFSKYSTYLDWAWKETAEEDRIRAIEMLRSP